MAAGTSSTGGQLPGSIEPPALPGTADYLGPQYTGYGAYGYDPGTPGGGYSYTPSPYSSGGYSPPLFLYGSGTGSAGGVNPYGTQFPSVYNQPASLDITGATPGTPYLYDPNFVYGTGGPPTDVYGNPIAPPGTATGTPTAGQPVPIPTTGQSAPVQGYGSGMSPFSYPIAYAPPGGTFQGGTYIPQGAPTVISTPGYGYNVVGQPGTIQQTGSGQYYTTAGGSNLATPSYGPGSNVGGSTLAAAANPGSNVASGLVLGMGGVPTTPSNPGSIQSFGGADGGGVGKNVGQKIPYYANVSIPTGGGAAGGGKSMAYGTGVNPGFKTGGTMPWTGPAWLHEGERVIPKGGTLADANKPPQEWMHPFPRPPSGESPVRFLGPPAQAPPPQFPPFPTLPPPPTSVQGLPGYFNNLRTAISPWLQMVPGWSGMAMMGR